MSAISIEPDIEAQSPLWTALPEVEELAARALSIAAEGCGVALRAGASVSVLFTDDDHIRAVNARWRGRDEPTNVLSFPAVTPEALGRTAFLGDIAIAFETARREAEAEGKSLADHATHLVMHGFLHLVGFDHQDDDEAAVMERLETRLLAALGIADPYAAPVAGPNGARADARHDKDKAVSPDRPEQPR